MTRRPCNVSCMSRSDKENSVLYIFHQIVKILQALLTLFGMHCSCYIAFHYSFSVLLSETVTWAMPIDSTNGPATIILRLYGIMAIRTCLHVIALLSLLTIREKKLVKN